MGAHPATLVVISRMKEQQAVFCARPASTHTMDGKHADRVTLAGIQQKARLMIVRRVLLVPFREALLLLAQAALWGLSLLHSIKAAAPRVRRATVRN